MKKLIILLISVLLTVNLFSQAPQKMSYQAVIRNANNILVNSSSVGMRISILQGSATGTPVYEETQTPTTNAFGLVSLEIGTGTIITGTFSSINWANGPYFIKTETDPTGGTSYTIIGTSEFLSVPYALYAKTAQNLSNSQNLFTHYIGELYGGGIIVALWKVAGIEKGIIASLKDVSSNTAWSNVTSSLIGSTAQSSIDGQANTSAIISQSGHITSAAKLCNDYTNDDTGTGVYSDWYLPSVWELNQVINAALIVNSVLGNTDGFKFNSYYWSSNETSDTSVIWWNSNSGSYNGGSKSQTGRVRAVRKL